MIDYWTALGISEEEQATRLRKIQTHDRVTRRSNHKYYEMTVAVGTGDNAGRLSAKHTIKNRCGHKIDDETRIATMTIGESEENEQRDIS